MEPAGSKLGNVFGSRFVCYCFRFDSPGNSLEEK